MACGAHITSKPPEPPPFPSSHHQPAACRGSVRSHTSSAGRGFLNKFENSSRPRAAPHVSGRHWIPAVAKMPIFINHLGRRLHSSLFSVSPLERVKTPSALCTRTQSRSAEALVLFGFLVSPIPGRKGRSASDGHRRRRLRVLLLAEDSPASQEEEAVPDGGDEGAHRLRRLRAEGEEGAGGHEGRELRGGDGEAEQGDGDGVRGRRQGDAPRRLQDGQAGGAVALRAVRDGGAPLRPRRLRQEGPRRVRPQRRRRPHRRAARQGVVHRGQVHRGVQRREPQRLLRHVVSLPLDLKRWQLSFQLLCLLLELLLFLFVMFFFSHFRFDVLD